MRVNFRWVLALTLLVCCAPVFAQLTTGNLVGTVFDSTGAVIPNVPVTAKNEATNVESRAQTTGAGQYQFSNLPVGSYTVTVDAPGFQKAETRNLQVVLSQTVNQNFNLQVASSASTVEVTDAAVAIDTTTPQIQSTYELKQIADLPISSGGSGVLNLSLLSAGVATGGMVGVGTGPSVGGQRTRSNNFTIEGVDNNNRSVTGPLVTPPNDDVAEFSLLQNQFSPEFGHSTGGQFNTILKSGTNEYHGMLYDYLINKNFNAIDQLNVVSGVTGQPRYDNNRLGMNFGGPIVRNKLFFFAGYEYQPIGQVGAGGALFAPTAAGYATIATLPGLSQTNLNVMKKYLGVAPVAADPASVGNGCYPTLEGTTDCSGAGTPIESGAISVVPPNWENTYTGVLSIDYNVSDRDKVTGRYINQRTDKVNTAATLPAFYNTILYRYNLLNVSEYHTFSPSIANELRLGYNRYYNTTPVPNINFPGLDAFPNITLDEYAVNIGPDQNAPQYTIINTYQLADNLSWIKGRHNLRFGFDGRRYISPQGFTQRQRGDYYYATLAAYLTDMPPDDFGERSAGAITYWANDWNLGWYGNDQWKVTNNLTLDLGLRYEFITLPAAENVQALNAAASVPGLITFGKPKAQKDAFMPRVGFAYSPGTSGKTSIRGGFGIGYDVLFDNLGLLSLPPQVQQTHDVGVDPTAPTQNFLASGGLSGAAPGPLSVADARATTGGFIPDQKRPKSLQWNFGIQQEFAQNYTLEVRYLGTRGLNLPVQDRINVASVVTPSFSLPTYTTAPTPSQLAGLPLTLSQIKAARGVSGSIDPAWYNAGFQSNITAYMPIGNSTYHGLATQLTRRFSNGLQFIGSYTWSHNIDDSTAEVFSTVTTPRRPENFQNLRLDRSDSALDHRNRFTIEAIYDVPFFKHSNWVARNLLGNWEISPIYTYQTGNWATVQSAVDANLNGDTWSDRSIVNPQGTDYLSTDVHAVDATGATVKTGSGSTVAYVANNPNARYIRAQQGTFPTGARNTFQMRPIDDLDATAMKRFTITERVSVQFMAQFINVLNHPQYVGGFLSDVASVTNGTLSTVRAYLTPGNALFNRPDQVFSSNPRNTTFAVKLIF